MLALRAGLVPLEHDEVATFLVDRGDFAMPLELFDEGNELELARAYASNLPQRLGRLDISRRRQGEAMLVTWRRIRVIRRRA